MTLQTIKAEKDLLIIGLKSCNYPKETEEKFVRVKTNIAGWILERQGNKTKATNISDIDPMGNIPDLIKNKMSSRRAEIVGEV